MKQVYKVETFRKAINGRINKDGSPYAQPGSREFIPVLAGSTDEARAIVKAAKPELVVKAKGQVSTPSDFTRILSELEKYKAQPEHQTEKYQAMYDRDIASLKASFDINQPGLLK